MYEGQVKYLYNMFFISDGIIITYITTNVVESADDLKGQ